MFKSKALKVKCLVLLLVAVFLTTSVGFAEPVHKNIFEEVSADNIYEHITVLAREDNARVTGFEGEHRAADYIEEQFESYGLQVERQEFPILAFLDNGAELTMNSPEEKVFETKNFSYTPPTPVEGLTAEIAFAGLGGV